MSYQEAVGMGDAFFNIDVVNGLGFSLAQLIRLHSIYWHSSVDIAPLMLY